MQSINENNQNFVLNFKLDSYDGPLDLLVELIKEKKMDILTLDISELTYQYLEFVNNNLTKLSIDNISEYLTMASYLTELKAKMIVTLMNPDTIYNETELEIDRLRRQLFLYKQYKDTINQFKQLQANRVLYLSKPSDNLDEYLPDDIPEAPLPDHVPIEKLVRAWQKVLLNTQAVIEDKEFLINVSNINIEEIEGKLTNYIIHNDCNETKFEDFFAVFSEHKNDVEYMCAIFLSLLVLCNNGLIKLRQDEPFGQIYVSRNDEIPTELIYEDVNEVLSSNAQMAKKLSDDLNVKTEISREKTKAAAKDNFQKEDDNKKE